MKKIIKFILVFVIVITLGIFNSSKVFAKEDDNPFDNNITEISLKILVVGVVFQ